MRKSRKVFIAAFVAVLLALCAVGVVACKQTDDGGNKEQYTLTFIVGTAPHDSITAAEGSAYKDMMKEAPTRLNYDFEGWSLSSGGAVVELPETMPSENRTYYAVFSARYNLKLNAGIGTISESDKTISAKKGQDLYSLVSGITPTVSGGDATFAGWFLRGTDLITETSGQKMPEGNAEVVAKYSVGYTINVYREAEFGSGNYDGAPAVVTSTAYVGEKIADLPSYDGYYFDTEQEHGVLTANLEKSSAQNTFSLYFKMIGYDLVFNANLPSEVEYTGDMDAVVCGFDAEYEMPACEFEADGYRFQGWSTTPDGDIDYYPGQEHTVERTITFYAQWVKGLTELAGLSSDRVYIMQQLDNPTETVVYFERFGLDDILGDYNPATGVFTIRNANAANPDAILLRGLVDISRNTFTYLSTSSETVYVLQKLDGSVDTNVTLSVKDDGSAVYNDGTDTFSGEYYTGEDGSMAFKANGKEFAFRLVQAYDERSFTNFMVRGEEYGTWNNLTQAGLVDLSYTLYLDGYGVATMYVSGLNSTLNGRVTTEFDGMYEYTSGENAYTGNEGQEVVVTLINSSYYVRQFACLLMTGEYYTVSANSAVYKNVYLERFVTTLYGAPAEGATLNKDTADKIELSGYSVLSDSATYTYTDSEGGSVTVMGKYKYDRTVGTLRIMPSVGDDFLFEVSLADDEERTPLFAPVEALFGQYAVLGLAGSGRQDYGNTGLFTLHIYNNNVAAFAFMIPVSDQFYGNILYEYTRLIYGSYSVVVAGKDADGNPDERANVYEYTAPVSTQVVNYIYSFYGNLFQVPINVAQFGSFRFQFVYSAQTGDITYVNTTALGDFQATRKIEYDGVEYTLDGFGSAVGKSAEGAELKLKYAMNTRMGINILILTLPASGSEETEETVLYMDAQNNGEYVQFEDMYYTSNAGTDTPFGIILFKDGTALLTLSLNTGLGYSTYYTFSYGTVEWDEDHIYGHYVRNDAIDFGDEYFALNKQYSDFTFSLITKKVTGSDGEEKEVTYLYLYEANENDIDADGAYTITGEGGDTLTLNRNDGTAIYVKKGDTDVTYSGIYRYFDGVVQFLYVESEDSKYYTVFTFRLEYNADDEIVSFHSIGGLVGYFVDGDDVKNYLDLTGEKTDEAGVYVGIYHLYNAETQTYREIEGTYRLSLNNPNKGYDFTYETGETDEDGKPVTETFTFGTAKNMAGIPYFQKYTLELNTYVYYMSAYFSKPRAVGTLTGGGYSAQVLTIGQTKFNGSLELNEEAGVWVFTATNGSVFYFKILSSVGPLLLDNTYFLETKGVFELSEAMDIEVPAKEATEDTEAVPAHTAHVTSIEMSGMAFAYLHYDLNGEDTVLTGIYVQYATNGFAFILLGEEDVEFSFRFRLMMYTDGETGDVTYVAELADMDRFGTYESDDLTVINLNGFTGAYYVDSYGRVYSGTFVITDEDATIIRITYIDMLDYTVHTIYAKLDKENRTFETVPAPAEEGNVETNE